jgi:hypothetical protein
MIWPLRALFGIILVWMTGLVAWASLQCPLFGIPAPVLHHPWFLATLSDAYCAFVTFYIWVAYKQTSPVAKAAWFFAVILLGNIAMATYCLRELWGVPPAGSLSPIFVRKRPGKDPLGIILAVVGIAVTLGGLPFR